VKDCKQDCVALSDVPRLSSSFAAAMAIGRFCRRHVEVRGGCGVIRQDWGVQACLEAEFTCRGTEIAGPTSANLSHAGC